MLNTIGNHFTRNILIIAGFTGIQFLLNIFSYRQVGIKMMSLTGVFTLLNYAFHLAQPFIMLIAPKYDFAFDASTAVSNSIYIESLVYSSLIIMAVSVGAMIYRSTSTKKEFGSIPFHSTELVLQDANLFRMGTYIFIFTFPLEAYLMISRLLTALRGGYLDTFNVELGGIPAFLATFSIVGVIMMILGSKENMQRGWMIYLAYVFFYTIAMLSGGRMWQIIKILLVTIYFVKTYDIKFTKKNIFWLLVIVYFGSGFLAAIADFRSYDFSNISFIQEVFVNVFQNNPILGILDEFGATVYTLGLVMNRLPGSMSFSWGSQFITGFVNLLPNISDSVTQMVNDTNYVLQLNVPAIGGSFIGELYYSFHYFGVIFALFVGMLSQYITEKIEQGMANKDYTFIIYSLLFQYSFISWVRGSSPTFYRNTIYSMILIYFINNVLFSNNRKVFSENSIK